MSWGRAVRAVPFAIAAVVVAPAPAVAQDGSVCVPIDQLTCGCDMPTGLGDPYPACFIGQVNLTNDRQIDSFSARAFTALHWPMSAKMAVFDAGRTPAGDYTTVLDGWKSTREIFRADGKAPVAWEDDTRVLPAACTGIDLAAAKARVGFADQIPAVLQPRLLDESVTPQGNVVIDAHKRRTRYEIAMNWQAYDYIAENRLWDAAGLDAYLSEHGKIDFPGGDWNPQTRGAMVAKMAWMILGEGDRPEAFHKSWAYVLAPETGACSVEPVGLIGLHLAFKMDGNVNWNWASFIQTAVAPVADPAGPLPTGGAWLFFDPTGSGPVNTKPDPDAPIVPARLVIDPGSAGGYPKIAGDDPTAGCQDWGFDYACFNRHLATDYAGSLIANYRLLGTQWTDYSGSSSTPVLTPSHLANATMESFIQPTSSCIACHATAKRPSDPLGSQTFDFIFSFADALPAQN
ncbi:MAG: hypothetical protein AAF281_04650 [Pseudomonadota bacterium]